ncbi:hypothetical protein ACFFGR_15975 [Arthrobacter liuii]|uniref:hypothetical protein n=1 Tax=Arthrobacter liuii TaxID=1476996 RepID=UPI0035EF95B1
MAGPEKAIVFSCPEARDVTVQGGRSSPRGAALAMLKDVLNLVGLAAPGFRQAYPWESTRPGGSASRDQQAKRGSPWNSGIPPTAEPHVHTPCNGWGWPTPPTLSLVSRPGPLTGWPPSDFGQLSPRFGPYRLVLRFTYRMASVLVTTR